jgi:DNA-binding CsgD family transcriptional regulator
VGRASEISVLGDLLARSAGGQATTVVVSGDAGVGKTRLLREFMASARAGGARAVSGDCPRLAGRLGPLTPVIDAVRALAAEVGRPALRVAAGRSWPLMLRHVPGLAEDAPADPDGPASVRPKAPAGPPRAHELLVTLLEQLGRSAPLVFAIEDVQWADRSTLDFAGFAARRLRTARVLLVLTRRTDEPPVEGDLHLLLAELDRAGIERLELQPLREAQLATLLEGIARRPLPRPLVEAIAARSQGYPFYAEELLAAWAEGDDDIPLPASLREVLLARTRSLPPATQELVRVLSAAGRRVDHAALAAVVGGDERSTTSRLRSAVERHIVDHDGRSYGFRHSLVQEAVYSEIMPGERIDLHRRFAEALERTRPPAGLDALACAELAHHWTVAGEPASALRASVDAGLAAERVSAHAEADRHFERALDLWSTVDDAASVSPVDRIDLGRLAADSAHLRGDAARAVTLIRSVLTAPDGRAPGAQRAALLYERLGLYLWGTGDARAAVEACEQACALVPPAPSVARARVEAALARLLVILTRYDAARRHAEDAVATARAVDARREEGHALTTLGVVLACTGEPDDGVVLLYQAQRIADEVDDPDDRARADYNLAAVLRGNGSHDEAVRVALAGARAAGRQGVGPAYGAFLFAGAAEALFVQGRWADADRHLSAALADPGLAMGSRSLHQVLAMLRTAQGRFADARHHLDAAVAAVGTRSSQPHGDLYPLLAELALWQGRFDDARRWASAARSSLVGCEDTTLVAQAAVLGLRAVADQPMPPGERRLAADELVEVVRGLPPYAGRVPGTRPWVATAEAEHARAGGRSAPDRWAEAARLWDGMGARYAAAWTRWREAEARLGRRGGRSAGAAVLRAARDEAVDLGAIPLVRALSDLAGAFGLDPASDAAADAALTRRELAVLRLLASGLTNRQIAGELFISQKTVGNHVSNIFEKLAVHTRASAASEAHRLGIT